MVMAPMLMLAMVGWPWRSPSTSCGEEEGWLWMMADHGWRCGVRECAFCSFSLSCTLCGRWGASGRGGEDSSRGMGIIGLAMGLWVDRPLLTARGETRG